MKRSFFQAAVVSILLYGCTTWKLTKRLRKKLDGRYTRMLRAILNKSWRQHRTRHQLYGHLLPITKTIQVRRSRHTGHFWRSKDELISDVLLWTPAYGQAKAGRPARPYIQQLCGDTGCNPEDLQKRWMIGRSDERGPGIWWWWWWYLHIFIYMYIFTYIFCIYIYIYIYTTTTIEMITSTATTTMIIMIIRPYSNQQKKENLQNCELWSTGWVGFFV